MEEDTENERMNVRMNDFFLFGKRRITRSHIDTPELESRYPLFDTSKLGVGVKTPSFEREQDPCQQ